MKVATIWGHLAKNRPIWPISTIAVVSGHIRTKVPICRDSQVSNITEFLQTIESEFFANDRQNKSNFIGHFALKTEEVRFLFQKKNFSLIREKITDGPKSQLRYLWAYLWSVQGHDVIHQTYFWIFIKRGALFPLPLFLGNGMNIFLGGERTLVIRP